MLDALRRIRRTLTSVPATAMGAIALAPSRDLPAIDLPWGVWLAIAALVVSGIYAVADFFRQRRAPRVRKDPLHRLQEWDDHHDGRLF